MHDLIEKDSRNAERIFPYIGGDEVTNNPQHEHHRYVIDFGDFPLRRDCALASWNDLSPRQRSECLQTYLVPADYPGLVAADWPDLLGVVERLVKPQRDKDKRELRRRRWWRFGDRQPGLYDSISKLNHVLAVVLYSPHLLLTMLPNQYVFSNKLAIFASNSMSLFCLLQGRIHEIWARAFSSTLEDRLAYAPSDCFETFPFEGSFEQSRALEAAGQAYHDHRAALMVARHEGMTKTYNRFHDPDERREDIVRLRELHAEMDRAVLTAYGWDDLAERAEPVFLDETTEDDHTYQGRLFWPSAFRDEVLARLLALNAERAAAERAAGLAPAVAAEDDDADEEDRALIVA